MAPTKDGEGSLGLTAFGLGLLTDATPPGAWAPGPSSGPALRLRSSTSQAIAESWSGLDAIGWEGTIDGAPFIAERGRAGDHRFVHGRHPDRNRSAAHSKRSERLEATRAIHHLSADASELQCAPADPADPSWWRLVLDSVLFTVALLQGYEALHAGAVAAPDGAIAIAATTGGGKSTLLSELLCNGLTLMADDVLVLGPSDADARPLAHPAPPLMTVPAARFPLLAEAGSATAAHSAKVGPVQKGGTVQAISSLGDERWIAVPVHPNPLPLAALVVLNRRPGLATALRRAQRPLAALLDSLLRFPRARARERARFELAGTIAAQVPIWELDADPSVAPDELAGMLLEELLEPDRAGVHSLGNTSNIV